MDLDVGLIVDRGGIRLNRTPHSRGFSLTDREVEVLRYIARGLAKKEISSLMNLSVRTVDAHVRNIMEKLSIHDRVDLARYAIREGLAEA